MSDLTATAMDLRSVIRSVHRQSGIADPRELALKIEASLADEDLREALRQALPDLVRTVVGEPLRHSPPIRTGEPSNNDSPRWERARRDVDALKAKLCSAGVFVGTWKPFGDCTRTEVETLVADREAKAAANTAKAEQYRTVAEEMRKRKAKKVSALPASVFGMVF